MIWKHKDLGSWNVKEFTQTQVEQVFDAFIGIQDKNYVRNNRLIVEAGIKSGIFEDEVDIEQLTPKQITYLAKNISKTASDAIIVPEEEAKN